MNNTHLTCDRKRIQLFLDARLSDDEQSEFERHLDDCSDCRDQLEATAARDEIWAGVREALPGQSMFLGLPRPDGQSSDDSMTDSATDRDAGFSQQAVLSLLAPTDDERMLGRLGTYEVAGVIGSGGMGVVLKAFDGALNRNVAIKVLAPHLASSGAARMRFSREAQAAAAVVHDNVVEIHGVADTDGLPWLVMPYVPGPSLQRRLDDEGALALVEILRIGMQTASGLAAAHAQGLVHRDVKPANILLADGVERVKLTDFGLARAADDASLTRTGIIAGTPQYMSPEQARGETVGQSSDLFSLGSVLYAMSTGRAPFRAETSYGVLRRVTDEEPRPIREINPNIPEWLCGIIGRLMSKPAEERFESAREVAVLLEECLAHVQQPTAVPLPASLVRRSADRRFSSAFLTGLGVIVSVVGLGYLGLTAWPGLEAPDISGRWEGPGWGAVELKETKPDEYEGTYTDTFKDKPGRIEIKWNEKELRFNGVWGEEKHRSGTISVRLAGEQILGAWTTSKESLIEPGSPGLSELIWRRPKKTASKEKGPSQVEGRILSVAEGLVELSLGLDDGLRNGMELVVSRDQQYRGTIEVIRLKANGSVARIIQEQLAAPIQKGDRVAVKKPRPEREVSSPDEKSADDSLLRDLAKAWQGTMPDSTPILEFSTNDSVRKIAYSPDGKRIAIGNGPPTWIARTIGGSRIKGDWKPSVEILDAATGKATVSLRLSTANEDKVIAGTERVSHFEVGALKFSPDGTLLAVGTSIGQVKLFDVRTGEVVRSLDDENAKLADEKTPADWKSLRRAMGGVVALAFSPDGRQLAMCGASFADFAASFNSVRRLTRSVTGPGRVKVWDVGTGELKYDLAGHDSHVNDVVFSPDGSMLASAGNWLTPDNLGTGVVLWSAHTGTEIRSFETSANGGMRSIAFSPDSRWLAIGTQRFDNSNSKEPSSGGVSLVQVSSGTVAWLVTVPGWSGSVEFLPDGTSLAVLCGGRSIRFLDTAAGKVQSEIRKSDVERGLWWDSAIAPQGDRLAIGVGARERSGRVEIRDLTALKLSEDDAAATASEN